MSQPPYFELFCSCSLFFSRVNAFIALDYLQKFDSTIRKVPKTPANLRCTTLKKYLQKLRFGWKTGASQVFGNAFHLQHSGYLLRLFLVFNRDTFFVFHHGGCKKREIEWCLKFWFSLFCKDVIPIRSSLTLVLDKGITFHYFRGDKNFRIWQNWKVRYFWYMCCDAFTLKKCKCYW